MNVTFKFSTIAALVALSLNSQGSMVRSDVDYQYFRDFAENKGQFQVGASNVEIYNKDGQSVGMMLANITMPDFQSVTTLGYATLVTHPQYLVSVAHNRGYTNVYFGYDTANPDNHSYRYNLVSRNDNSTDPAIQIANTSFYNDYQNPRLDKLVTEVIPATPAPIELHSNGSFSTEMFFDTNRYTHFMRAGSGTQGTRDADGTQTNLSGAYSYLTGGAMMPLYQRTRDAINFRGTPYSDQYGPLVTFLQGGDSGSGLFAWDNLEKRWVYAATVTTISTDTNNFLVYRPPFFSNILQRDTAGTLHNNTPNTQFNWLADGATSAISDNQISLDVGLFDGNLTNTSGSNAQQQNGRNVLFTGENSTLTLANNINQGAGYLQFDANVSVTGATANTTWQGSGVIVGQGKTVNWQIHNPEGDRLSKLGEGTLNISGSGENLGSISVGDGTVLLNQQTDNQGKKQAFSELGIVSGRPTVVLGSADQMNPNNIYFGYHGGRLDLNGNALTFNRIQNVDDGAMVVNHNANQSAKVTLTGNEAFTANDIQWGNWRETGKDIYRYNYNRHVYYFALTGNANAYYPTNGQSNANWELLATDDEQAAVDIVIARKNSERLTTAYNGYLGETDSGLTNGKLDVTFKPSIADATLLISGGTHLNGTLAVEQGKLLLSGRPTPFARNRQTNSEVIKEDDWLNRQFNATTFAVSGQGELEIGRNVNEVNGNFRITENGKASLGFTAGKGTVCIRSDYTGVTSCSENTSYSEQTLNTLPTTQIQGNVLLNDNAVLNLGSSARLQGTILGTDQSLVELEKGSEWVLNRSSVVNDLTLNDGTITLNSQFDDQETPHRYNTLTIDGTLSGSGRFQFMTDIADLLGDKINLNGEAYGNFSLYVKDSGKEPAHKDRLTLVTSR